MSRDEVALRLVPYFWATARASVPERWWDDFVQDCLLAVLEMPEDRLDYARVHALSRARARLRILMGRESAPAPDSVRRGSLSFAGNGRSITVDRISQEGLLTLRNKAKRISFEE